MLKLEEAISNARPEFRSLLEVYDQMLTKVGRKGVALRKHFNPMRLRHNLANTSILEVTEEKTFLFRVAGSSLTSRIGYNPEKLNPREIFPEQYYDRTMVGFNTCIDTPCGAIARYAFPYTNGATVQAESISLPIIGFDGKGQIVFQSSGHTTLSYDEDKKAEAIDTTGFEIEWVDIGFGTPE